MATARVRRLDTAHDATFGAGFANYARGAEATAQRVKCRLLVILGEWFLDTTLGVPWFQPPDSDVKPIMGGPTDLQYAEAVIKTVILETDGIATIESFTMAFDSQTRQLTVQVTVTSVDGDVANIRVDSP